MDIQIQLARFRLNPKKLRDYSVAILDFPFESAINDFLHAIRDIRANKKPLEWDELPPFDSLNDMIMACSPMLVHPFEEYGQSVENPAGRSRKKRRMLALAQDGVGNPIWRPSVEEDITDVVLAWSKIWLNHCFQDEHHKQGWNEAYERLIDGITHRPEHDWREINAYDLWQNRNLEEHVGYDALPSLLSVLFISHPPAKDSENQTWFLAHEGKKLAVVTPPFNAISDGKSKGLMSYKLDFSIQTQGGGHEAWVYVNTRVRRYMEQVTSTNHNRDTTVFVQLHEARINNWEYSPPTMIGLRVRGNVYFKEKKRIYDQLSWKSDYLVELLSSLKARPLVEPSILFPKAAKFQKLDSENGDSYYVLFAEGMSPRPKIETGVTFGKRLALLKEVQQRLEGIVDFSQPLLADKDGSISMAEIHSRRDDSKRPQYLALFSLKDLRDKPLISRAPIKVQDTEKQRLVIEALHRASTGQPVHIHVFYHSSGTHKTIRRYIDEALFLDKQLPLPENLYVHELWFNEDLATAPGKSEGIAEKPSRSSSKDQWHGNKRAYFEQKVRSWSKFLKEAHKPNGYNLAFIEMDGRSEKSTAHDDWHKRALRQACVMEGFNSQMIWSVSGEALESSLKHAGDLSRVIRATSDLLLRQTAAFFAPPSQLYRLGGLEERVANDLTVIGLYRHRKNAHTRVDFPVAVCLYPDGYVKVILPDENGNPRTSLPYIEAGIELGKRFVKNPKNAQCSNEQLRRFLLQIMTFSYETPTLLLLESDGWRSKVFPALKDESLGNKINFNDLISNSGLTASPISDLTRIIRVRDAGSLGETPQYLLNDETDSLIGFMDLDALSELPHYYSIGRRPVSQQTKTHKSSGETQLLDEGIGFGYKHQQVVEFIPFYLQPSDRDPFPWCRIPHLLRSSPAWNGGNIVLPYPLHLAKTLMEDLMDVFAP